MLTDFNLFGFTIYSYPLMVGIAIAVGIFCSKKLCSQDYWYREKFNFHVLMILLLAWVGAKAFFYFFYDPKHEELTAGQFVLGGGFVFYGGLIASAFYLFILKIWKNYRFDELSFIVPALAIAHAIGRVGCILAGCCYGVEYNGPFSVNIDGVDRFPIQLVESLILCFLSVLLWKMHRNIRVRKNVLAAYFLSYPVIRFVLEFYRGDWSQSHSSSGLSVSQYISIAIFFVALIPILKGFALKRAL